MVISNMKRKWSECMWKVSHLQQHANHGDDTDRPSKFKSERGRILVHLELLYKSRTIGLQKLLEITEDWVIIYIKYHEIIENLYSIIKVENEFVREFQVNVEDQVNNNRPLLQRQINCKRRQI